MDKLDEAPLVKEIVLEKLRNQIQALRSNTNVRIPSERSLSEHFGVSRLSIRAAIKALAAEGLLVQLQGKGTYITPLAGLNSIGLICSPDIKRTDPFYNKFLAEMVYETAKRSIHLVMVDSTNLPPAQTGTPLIIIGLLQNKMLRTLSSCYSPIISIQEYPWLADISQVSFDDYKIGCDAARILSEYNHKHILHLAGPEKYPSAFFRKKGFRDAAEKLGIHVVTATDKMNWAGGYNQGGPFLQKWKENGPPTAVFAANDWMAAGFMKRLQENGIKIPEDISVLGCDNIPLAAEYTPSLSTFDLNMKLLVKELFMIMEDCRQTGAEISAQNAVHSATESAPATASKRVMLPATPIIRNSIKKL